ncbi:MAG: integrase arm-type DNA-binding domain-containing protein [Pseudomonadota bacterium]
MPKLSTAWMDRSQEPGLHWCSQTPGLGARVFKCGRRKSWVHQKSGGKRQTLGRWPDITVNDARAQAANLHAAAPVTAPTNVTLLQAHEAWARDHIVRGGSEGTVDLRRRRLQKHVPDLLRRPVSSLTKIELTNERSRIAENSIHSARDVIGHVCQLVRLADDRDVRLPELRRPRSTRASKITDIAAWAEEVRPLASDAMWDAHVVVALTGLRQGEVRQMCPSGIEDGRVFIPAPKSKMGEDLSFWRHLPRQVVSILNRQPAEGDQPFFPFQRIQLDDRCDTHALRHHFIGLGESATGVPRRVMRALVNHRGRDSMTDGYGVASPEECDRWSQEIADLIAKRISL